MMSWLVFVLRNKYEPFLDVPVWAGPPTVTAVFHSLCACQWVWQEDEHGDRKQLKVQFAAVKKSY